MGGRSGQGVRIPIPNLQQPSGAVDWTIDSETGTNETGFTAEELVSLTGLPDDFEGKVTIRYTPYGAKVIIRNIDEGVTIEREIYPASKTVYNAYFSIDENGKYKGRSLEVFSNQVNSARQKGFENISVYAAGQGDGVSGAEGVYNGYNTWARYGYQPTSQTAALNRIEFKTGEKYDSFDQMMRSKEGAESWRLHGRAFDGNFDLNPNSVSSKRLIDYQNSKKTK